MWKQVLVMMALATAVTQGMWAVPLPQASADKLPRWRGFNLLEKFVKEWSNGPFLEEDFRLISELGFNFVRLPMDYRTWIVDGDWTQFDESVLREIDQAVAWGGQYGLHVSIYFHRAPGYTVATPGEPTNLWTDEATQAVCADHWAHFARRYKGIPNERLSFNLVNEPPNIDGKTYARVAGKMVAAIRAEDPDRLIIADGLAWGRKPCEELLPLKVARATRGYEPMAITHYKAPWVAGTENMPVPTWPLPEVPSYLYGPAKADLHSPLRFEGKLTNPCRLRLRVGTVSDHGKLTVTADGKAVWDKTFDCGPGEGEWDEAHYVRKWDLYQNRYDRDYVMEIPAGTRVVEVANTEGDWLTLTEVGLLPGGENATEGVLGTNGHWGKRQVPVKIMEEKGTIRFSAALTMDRAWLEEQAIKPWKALQRQGVGVMVGEWGAFNKTPHDVVIRWMEDCLKNWKEVGWGWALWNFRGPFGILDSGRADVEYEDWHGHKLDREMLNLLLRY